MKHTFNSNAPIYRSHSHNTESPIQIHFKRIPINYVSAFKDCISPDEYTCTELSTEYFSVIVCCSFVAIDSDQLFVGFADDKSILVSFDDFKPKEVEVIYGKFEEATEE